MSDVRIRAVKNGYIITSDFVAQAYIATSLQEVMDRTRTLFEELDEEERPAPPPWAFPLHYLSGDQP